MKTLNVYILIHFCSKITTHDSFNKKKKFEENVKNIVFMYFCGTGHIL